MDMAISASSRTLECGTRIADSATRALISDLLSLARRCRRRPYYHRGSATFTPHVRKVPDRAWLRASPVELDSGPVDPVQPRYPSQPGFVPRADRSLRRRGGQLVPRFPGQAFRATAGQLFALAVPPSRPRILLLPGRGRVTVSRSAAADAGAFQRADTLGDAAQPVFCRGRAGHFPPAFRIQRFPCHGRAHAGPGDLRGQSQSAEPDVGVDLASRVAARELPVLRGGGDGRGGGGPGDPAGDGRGRSIAGARARFASALRNSHRGRCVRGRRMAAARRRELARTGSPQSRASDGVGCHRRRAGGPHRG